MQYYIYKWKDGNLIEAEEYAYGEKIGTIRYWYDNHPNAYSSLPKYLELIIPYNWTKNNVYKFTLESTQSDYSSTEEYDIIYNEKGYPTEEKQLLYDYNNEPIETNPIVFEYNCGE